MAAGNNASVKIVCDLNRICEIEDAVVEWYEERWYDRRPREEMYDLGWLKGCFTVEEVMYAGVDGIICKAKIRASRKGVIPKDKLGLEIQVKDVNEEVTNEVKRLGYMKDREAPV